jgi:hypothetical protein
VVPKVPQGCLRGGALRGEGGNFSGMYLITMIIKLGHVCGSNMKHI